MRTQSLTRKPRWRLPVATVAAALLVFLAVSPVAAKKPAFHCALPPGDTTVSWKGDRQTTQLDLEWFDENGVSFTRTTVTPTKEMHFQYSQPTPAGAVEFGVTYSDETGPFAVGGMVCM